MSPVFLLGEDEGGDGEEETERSDGRDQLSFVHHFIPMRIVEHPKTRRTDSTAIRNRLGLFRIDISGGGDYALRP